MKKIMSDGANTLMNCNVSFYLDIGFGCLCLDYKFVN